MTSPTSAACGGVQLQRPHNFPPVGRRPPHNAKFSGIRTMARRLATAVIDTDSATSPRAWWVTMFDTFPGGQQATRIIPSATEPCTPRAG